MFVLLVRPTRWYERAARVALPAALANAEAMVGRFLLVRVPAVGGCQGSGWCLAQVEGEHTRQATRVAAVYGVQRIVRCVGERPRSYRVEI